MPLYEMGKFHFKFQCNHSYMKDWTLLLLRKPNANNISMQMHSEKNMPIFFLYFNYHDMKIKQEDSINSQVPQQVLDAIQKGH